MLEIRLLGQLAVHVDGRQVEPPRSRRARELLAWLALHPGLHPRGEVAARFWPDVLESSARASLRSALWALRKALGPGGRHLLADRELVGVDGGPELWVDVAAFRALVADGRLEEAVSLPRGELLCDLDADWVLEARPGIEQEVAEVLSGLAADAENAGDLPGSLRWSRRAVELHPLGEDAWRQLIERLIAAGDAPGAVAAYRRMRERFRRELGISPSAETRALVETLRAAQAGGEDAAAEGEDRAAARESAARGPTPPRAIQSQPTPSAHHPPLVGRERELEELEGFAEAARTGSGSAVAITGEPGIGKTRLVAAVAALAAEGHALTATAAASGAAASFALWSELVDDLTEKMDPATADGWAARLWPISPRLASRLAAPADAHELPPDLRRARLFDAVAELLSRLASEQWLLLVLEDLHAADRASLDLLAYVGRRLPRLRALAVLTRRDSPPSPRVDLLLDGLRSRGALSTELTLTRLPDAEVRRLAHLAAPLPDVEPIVEVAAGSPLVAVESARAVARGERAVPGSLRSLARAWLASLPAETRSTAELIAVAGRELDRDELAALGIDASSSAGDAGLLLAGSCSVGYRHSLLAEAVYANLGEPRRATLHETVADALASVGDRRAVEVAEHLRRAGRADRASEALRAAARHARSVGSLEEAVALLEVALEENPDDAGLWLELAEAEAWRDRRDAVERAFGRALERIEPDDIAARVDAWLRRATWYKSTLCTPHLALESASTALEELDVAGIAAPDAEARALAAAAWAHAVAGDPEDADRLLDRLDSSAGARGPSDVLQCEIGNARGTALIRRGRFEECREPLDAAARAAVRAGRPDLASSCWSEASCAAACAGDLHAALALNGRALAALRGHGLVAFEAQIVAERSQILLRAGRLVEARAQAERARELGERLDSGDAVAEADHQRALVAFELGEHEAAAELLAAALAADPPISRPLARLTRAEALVRLGRLDEASSEVRSTALEPVGPGDAPDALVPRLARVQGLLAAASGDRGLAARRLDEAAAGWRRRIDRESMGQRYAAVLADFGRSPLAGLVEPERELQRVLADRRALEAPPTDRPAAAAAARPPAASSARKA